MDSSRGFTFKPEGGLLDIIRDFMRSPEECSTPHDRPTALTAAAPTPRKGATPVLDIRGPVEGKELKM
jgi:hypothetical protein